MSQGLTAKQRATALQHWCSLIMRECRDLAALERLRARAEQDRDVRADAQLQSMVRAEFERRRADLQREGQRAQQTATIRRHRPTSDTLGDVPGAPATIWPRSLMSLNREPAPRPSAPPESHRPRTQTVSHSKS
jgi:hypothetical protein